MPLGSTVPSQFLSEVFRLFDGSDVTKKTKFVLSGIASGNVRALTIPDSSGVIALEGHVHPNISVLAGLGLSGGGTLGEDRTLVLDITEFDEDVSPVAATDYLVVYDASASTHKKVLLTNILESVNSFIELGDTPTSYDSADIDKILVVKSDLSGLEFTDSPTFDMLRLENQIQFFPKTLQPLITFIFDDGHDTTLSIAKPVFDTQGEVACSAPISDYIGTGNYLDSIELNTLQNAGWEILSHSKSHIDLTTLSNAEIITELLESKQALEALGLTIRNFVYPFGTSNEIVRRLTRSYYRSARAIGGEGLINAQVLDTFKLRAYNADDHTKLAEYQAQVDIAESGNQWLIFYFHAVDSDDATMLNTLIDYIQAKNIDVVTVNEALDLVGNVIDVGDNFAVNEAGIRANFVQGMVGLGVIPTSTLSIGSYDKVERLDIHHTNVNAHFKTSKGLYLFQTDEGTNTNSYLVVKGKGSGRGYLYAYDEDDAEAIEIRCSLGHGYIRMIGASPGPIHLQDGAHSDVRLFANSTSGETKALRIYGYKAGDAQRHLAITTGGTANDTVDFTGLSNYKFDGIIQATDFAKTGWPVTPGVTLSFVGGTTRTFTVADDDSAYYYIDGVKYILGGNKTVVIGDVEGLWYIYFDGATLTASQTIWSFVNENKALVAYLYWARDVGTPANGKAIFIGYEPHSFHMSGATHARLHYAGGARWETGLLVADNLDNTVDVSAGDIWDEDLNIPITDDDTPTALFEQILSPAQLPIYYREGASNWRIYETNEKAALTDVGYLTGGLLQYNDPTGTWSNTEVGGNNYVAYYVVATNEQTEPVVLIMGQRVDNKLSEAKVNNVFSGLSLAGLPFQEMAVLARLILKDTATYTLEEVLDLRAYNIKGNITSPLITQHAGLGGLNWSSAGHYFDAAVDFNAQNISSIGTVGCGVITQSGATLAATYQPLDAELTSLAALSYVAASFVKMTGANTFALRTIGETADDLEGTIDHNNLANYAANQHFLQSAITEVGTIATGTWQSTDVGIAYGGTGQSTAQLAINALSAVSGATNEHVLTKDTASGNAIWKVAAGGAFTSKCSVYRSGIQAMTSGAYTKIQFNTEDYDTNGEFDSSSNYRFQPDANGYYAISSALELSSLNDTDIVVIAVYKNGAIWKAGKLTLGVGTGVFATISCDMYLITTDYIEIWCYHDYGSNRSVGAAGRFTFLDVHRFA